ncbi:MAG: hypothetical protein ACR2FY_05065 [Pirellulaceae bacterium]
MEKRSAFQEVDATGNFLRTCQEMPPSNIRKSCAYQDAVTIGVLAPGLDAPPRLSVCKHHAAEAGGSRCAEASVG